MKSKMPCEKVVSENVPPMLDTPDGLTPPNDAGWNRL